MSDIVNAVITIQIGGERDGVTVSITDPRPRTDRSEGWLDSVIEIRTSVWTGRYPGQFHE